jgi:tetratricopeptide (TPR) repeat protein
MDDARSTGRATHPSPLAPIKHKLNKLRNKMKLISIILLLTICDVVLSQDLNSQTFYQYRLARNRALESLQKKDYSKALEEYETALSYNVDNELGTAYYNAACCAAQLKNYPLAFKYLDSCLMHGFLFYEHVLIDEDLIPLHKFTKKWTNFTARLKNHVNDMNRNLDLFKKFVSENPDKFKDLIPFESASKWGYLERETKKIIVKPIFDCADFFSTSSALVLYKMNLYRLDRNGIQGYPEITKNEDDGGQNIYVVSWDNIEGKTKEKNELTPFQIRELMKDTLFSVFPDDKMLFVEDYKSTKVHAI